MSHKYHRELPHRIATENCHRELPHRMTKLPQIIATPTNLIPTYLPTYPTDRPTYLAPTHFPTSLPPYLPTTNIRPHFEFYNFLKVFLGGHDDFGPSGHQSAQESIIPHLLGESYNIPRMDLPSIGLCVEIDIPALPGFCQIRPFWVPKTLDFGKCSNR